MGKILLTKEIIQYILDSTESSHLDGALSKLLDRNQDNFQFDVADTLASLLEIRLYQHPKLLGWINSLRTSLFPLPKYLYFRLNTERTSIEHKIEDVSKVIDLLSVPDPFLLLGRARLMVKAKRKADAAKDLQFALSLYPPYSFYIKSEKLIEKIMQTGEWLFRRKLKVALLGSSTTTFLASVLMANCFRDGINITIYEGAYGNYQQEILNPVSGLYEFQPDLVILLPNHRDLSINSRITNQDVTFVDNSYRNLWGVIQRQNPCHIIQMGFDVPMQGSWGTLEDSLAEGRGRFIRQLNELLSYNMPSGVSYLDINRVAHEVGHEFYNLTEWYSSKQYPGTAALPLLADVITAQIRAAFGLSSKVLVLDLDNTLWGGIIGEDGISGIVLGPPSPEGEGYLDLHRFAKDLKEKGGLLAICSKNNLADAQRPFNEHDSTLLKLDDFVVFTANWQDKASNIKEMAEKLSLGLDSFVFLDDNPLERSWVRAQLPQVVVPECGNKPWSMLHALRRGRYFETVAVTGEDLERHQSYKANINRKEMESQSASLEDFLAGLDMIAESGPVDDRTLVRVTQLINKTNQFNLTTQRYTEEQVRSMMDSPSWWTRWYRLKDRFGDHGLIGVVLAQKNQEEWVIDTWLMSCRVLGRKMENYMCQDILTAAREAGAGKVYGNYIPTAKNMLVKDLYKQVGFEPTGKDNTFVFDLTVKSIPGCPFIRSQ